FFTAQQAAASTRAYFLFYIAAGALYLIMTMSSNVVFRRCERRVNRGRAPGGRLRYGLFVVIQPFLHQHVMAGFCQYTDPGGGMWRPWFRAGIGAGGGTDFRSAARGLACALLYHGNSGHAATAAVILFL